MQKLLKSALSLAVAATATVAFSANALAADWKPKKPVEFIIMAGTGGGADQIARLLQGLIEKKSNSCRRRVFSDSIGLLPLLNFV